MCLKSHCSGSGGDKKGKATKSIGLKWQTSLPFIQDIGDENHP